MDTLFFSPKAEEKVGKRLELGYFHQVVGSWPNFFRKNCKKDNFILPINVKMQILIPWVILIIIRKV